MMPTAAMQADSVSPPPSRSASLSTVSGGSQSFVQPTVAVPGGSPRPQPQLSAALLAAKAVGSPQASRVRGRLCAP